MTAHAAPSPPPSHARAPATWTSSQRLASFVAHVVSGALTLGVVGAYLLQLLTQSLADAPALRARAQAWLLAVLQRLHHRMLPSCLTSARPIPAVMVCMREWLLPHDRPLSDREYVVGATVTVAMAMLLGLVTTKYKSVGWYCALQLVVLLQWCVALYQVVRIVLSLAVYVAVKLAKLTASTWHRARINVFGIQQKQAHALRALMRQARTYREWAGMAEYLDTLEDKAQWKATLSLQDHEHCDFQQLRQITQQITDARASRNVMALKYLLTSAVMRNKVGIDAPHLHLDCHTGTKHVIAQYQSVVVQAIEWLSQTENNRAFPRADKVAFFRGLRQSLGATALCLSGGGAIAMYHMGVLKALLEADLMPQVISGSSGGSIVAALVACNTDEELQTRIIQNDIAVRYIPLEVRWFPPLMEQLEHCIKTGFLVKNSDFERTTRHYYAEPMDCEEKTLYYTFQDAFRKTGRHVCITVSASDVTGHKGPKKLLLNHVSTPHVLLWSAVAVSCSLPGIMKGKKLMARDHEGNVVPFDAIDKEWVDGSIQHDLPMETMASCFNVTNFIVSQVNPHVVPFVSDDIDTPNVRDSLFHTLESLIAGDVRHRLKMLAFLGLFPKIYGHQFSSYFKQNFSGHVTLIPDFIFLETIGIKAIVNPSREDMDRYILGGQRAVWPKLAYIGHLCVIEKCLDRCLRAHATSTGSPRPDHENGGWEQATSRAKYPTRLWRTASM